MQYYSYTYIKSHETDDLEVEFAESEQKRLTKR